MNQQTPPDADVETRVDSTVIEQRRVAGLTLGDALKTSGVHSLSPTIGTTRTPAITVIVYKTAPAAGLLTGDDLPTPDAAAALQQALHRQGVEACVDFREIGPGPALQIAIATTEGTQRFTQMVMDNLFEPQAAGHRLRTALAAAHIKADDLRVCGDTISVGDLSAADALTLYEILCGAVPGLDLSDWYDLERFADRLASALLRASGKPIDALANPVCSTCRDSRPPEVTLGTVTTEQAQRLADAVDSANDPDSASPAAPAHSEPQFLHPLSTEPAPHRAAAALLETDLP